MDTPGRTPSCERPRRSTPQHRRADCPTDVPSLVAVSEDTFGLAVTAGPSASGSAHLLTDPTGALTEAPLPVTLPRVQRHFAIASSANVLVVVLADWGDFGGPPPSATVLRIDLTTGLTLTTAVVPVPLFVNAIAVDRHGTRLLISSADSNLGVRGVFSGSHPRAPFSRAILR